MKRILARLIPLLSALMFMALLGAGCDPKAKRDQHLARAQTYFAAGEYDKAEIEYLNTLRLDPKTPDAIPRLGIIYFDQGRYGKAVPFLLRGRAIHPDDLAVRTRLAQLFLVGGKATEARVEIDFVLERNPADPEAPLMLVQTVGRKPGDLEAAHQRLNELVKLAPASAALHVALGSLEFRRRNLTAAAGELDQAKRLDPDSSLVNFALGTLHAARGEPQLAEQSFARSSELAPDRSMRRLLYARFKVQNGDLAAARASLEKIVQKTPDFLPAGTLLAEILLAEKKPDQANTLVERLLARDGTNLDVLLLSGRIKVALGQSDKAIAELDKARNLYPKSGQAHYQYGLVLLAGGKTRDAIAALNQAVNLDPGLTDASLLLASISMLRGDAPGAIVMLKQLLQKRPDLERAHAMLADASRVHGDLDTALRLYEFLEQRSPTRPEFPLARGLVLAQQAKPAEARKAFERSLELLPDSLPAIEQLLNLDLQEKRYDQAGTRIQQLAERKPDIPEPRLLLARIALAQSDTPTAIVELEKAIAIQPEYRPAYLMVARVYQDNHETDKALERLRSLVEKNPKDVAALMTIGTLCEQEKRFPESRDAYEKLLVLEPRFSPALNNLAYLFGEHFGELDKAADLARKARELRPGDPAIADTLGWILYKKGEYARALPLLQESAGRLPDEPEIQFHLGMVSYALADEAAAREAFQHALARGVTFSGVDEARRRLALLQLPDEPSQQAALEQRLAVQPDDPVAGIKLARIHGKTGDLTRAKSTYQSLLEKHPQNVAALCGLARLLQPKVADRPKALELAKTAYKLAPDDPNVTRTLGQLAYATGDHKWAVSLLQLAARKQENDSGLLFDLATAEYATGNVEDSIVALRSALQNAGPASDRADQTRLFLELIELAANPGGPESRPKIEAALKSQPDFLPALAASAALAELGGNAKTAIDAYENILRRFPSFDPATRQLALLRAAAGSNDKQATELLFKAREAYPADPALARALGFVLFRTGDFQRATTFFKECSARFPNDAELFYSLGLAQARLKDREAARRSLSHALELDPNSPRAADAQRTLNQLK